MGDFVMGGMVSLVLRGLFPFSCMQLAQLSLPFLFFNVMFYLLFVVGSRSYYKEKKPC